MPMVPIDIAILTVIPPELRAARTALGISKNDREKLPSGTVVYRKAIRSELVKGTYQILLACVGRSGNKESAVLASELIHSFHPRTVLLMGIAAGIRKKVRIGEVVLSEMVVDYEKAALVKRGGKPIEEPRPTMTAVPHTINQDVVNYLSEPSDRPTQIFLSSGEAFPEPPLGQEKFFRDHVAHEVTAKISTFASGDKLLRNPDKLRVVRRYHGKVEIGEMEAAGLVCGL